MFIEQMIADLQRRVTHLEGTLRSTTQWEHLHSTLPVLAAQVAEVSGLPIERIRSERRDAETVNARDALCLLAARDGIADALIGEFLKRERSTISMAETRARERVATDRRFRTLVKSLDPALVPNS